MRFFVFVLGLALFLIPPPPPLFSADNEKKFTLTTYYPAPYGDYKRLKATESITVTGSSEAAETSPVLKASGSSGTGLVVTNSNRAGIGTTDPQAAFDVRGDMRISSQLRSVPESGSVSTATNVINWNNGNMIIANPTQASLTFQNMQEGGSYTLIVTSATSRTYTFSQSSPNTIVSGAFKFAPANAATTASKTTVYTFIRAGGVVYVSWIKDF